MKAISLACGKYIYRIDITGEFFLLSHRISIGHALKSAESDYEAMQSIIQILHGYKMVVHDIAPLSDYYHKILEGISTWIEREKQLVYNPTAEEKEAGIDQLSKRLGEFSTVDAIALRMHCDHDSVMKLPYSTVYQMLLKDLEQSKYERRLMQIQNRKWKQ